MWSLFVCHQQIKHIINEAASCWGTMTYFLTCVSRYVILQTVCQRNAGAHLPSGYKQWSCYRAWQCIPLLSGTFGRTPPSTTVWGCHGGRTGPLGTWTIASLRRGAKVQGAVLAWKQLNLQVSITVQRAALIFYSFCSIIKPMVDLGWCIQFVSQLSGFSSQRNL